MVARQFSIYGEASEYADSCLKAGALGLRSRACAYDNEIPYIRLHKNTSSSIRMGGGNCGKPKNNCATMDFRFLCSRLPVVKRSISGGNSGGQRGNIRHKRKNEAKRGKNGAGGTRKLSLWKISGMIFVEKQSNLSTGICGFRGVSESNETEGIRFSTGASRKIRVKSSKFTLLGKNYEIIHKISHNSLWKISVFPHSFPQPVEKSGENPQNALMKCGFSVEYVGLFNRGSSRDQLPRISLIISSISARNTGF